MSIETIEGIEDIQRDEETEISEDQEKKLRIHLPIKQVSTSSYGSRRSSVSGVVPGRSNPEELNKVSEKFKSFSVIKEKRKLRSLKQRVKKKARRKTGEKKKPRKQKTDNEECESDPDVSEIILTKPPVSVVIHETEDPKDEMTNLTKKNRKKGKKKSRVRKRRRVAAAEELEKLLQEKNRLLQEELAKLDPKKAPSNPDSSFFPAPKSLEKRRCYFHKGAKALKCTVCSGVHYRTKRTFRSNLRILAKINLTFLNLLHEMRTKMSTIDGNLGQVKRNLEYLEEMYDTIFRKVNRLFVDVEM